LITLNIFGWGFLMSRKFGWALASAVTLSIGGVGTTVAADLPVKAPVKALPAPVATWTGCYVGANGGGIIGGDRYSLAQGGDFLAPNNIFSSPANNITDTFRSRDSGFTGGGQVGCNWQAGAKVVWGVEGDINGATRLTDTRSFGPLGPFAPVPGNNPGALLAASHTETLTKDLNWFATFRGRVGFLATPTLLLYGTGGLAVADINSSTNVVFGTDQFFLGGFNFNGSTSTTRAGWTVGAGAEWLFAPHWSVKAEYLFLDFGSFGYNSPCTSAPPGSCGPGTNFLWTTSVRAQEHIARFGVNYHFGGPIVAKY
jgi:outer membrane immunogenic protein